MDDFDVINRVQAGDVEAFSILVEKYHRHLLNFIFRLTGDEQLVEDIGQDVFLRVYKSIRKFDIERASLFLPGFSSLRETGASANSGEGAFRLSLSVRRLISETGRGHRKRRRP